MNRSRVTSYHTMVGQLLTFRSGNTKSIIDDYCKSTTLCLPEMTSLKIQGNMWLYSLRQLVLKEG